jgi:hypothetical protein
MLGTHAKINELGLSLALCDLALGRQLIHIIGTGVPDRETPSNVFSTERGVLNSLQPSDPRFRKGDWKIFLPLGDASGFPFLLVRQVLSPDLLFVCDVRIYASCESC